MLSALLEVIFCETSTRMSFEFNADIINHINSSPSPFFQGRDTTYLNQHINNDTSTIIVFCFKVMQEMLIHLNSYYHTICNDFFSYNNVIGTILVVFSFIYYITYFFSENHYILKNT